MAAGRRGVFEAFSSDEPRALVIIGFIRWHQAEGPRGRGPDKFYAWIAAERPKVPDEAPIARAMNYLVNHRIPLTRFLDEWAAAAGQ